METSLSDPVLTDVQAEEDEIIALAAAILFERHETAGRYGKITSVVAAPDQEVEND